MWEGNNIFFFVPITTFYQTQQYTSVSVVSKRICCRSNESKCSCFSKGLQQQLLANEAKAHFCGGGEIKNFLYPTPTTGQLLLFAFSYSSPLPHCSLRRTKSRKNKILNILLFSSHALGASGDSHQQMRNDRARAARCFSGGRRMLESSISLHPVISPTFSKWPQVFQVLLKQFSCFFFGAVLNTSEYGF